MARKNKTYERTYYQLVKDCIKINESMQVKKVTVPDSLSLNDFKVLAGKINAAAEKLPVGENVKLPTEFRKIYPKLASSLLVLENRLEIIELEKSYAEMSKNITNFETAIMYMLNTKSELKELAEKRKAEMAIKNGTQNVPKNNTQNVPENNSKNMPEKSSKGKNKKSREIG